jgi:hypothetical protein
MFRFYFTFKFSTVKVKITFISLITTLSATGNDLRVFLLYAYMLLNHSLFAGG